MTISVVTPIGLAIDRTKHILFRPFEIGKWFLLGFCAWLATLGEGGGSGFGSQWKSGGRGGGPGSVRSMLGWIEANTALVVALVIAGLIVVVGLSALVLWLQSRGQFMFLDGVVHNRGVVVEPWRALRRLGNSLFGFSFVLTIFGLLSFVLILAICVVVAWSDIQANTFGNRAVAGTIAGVVLLATAGLTFGVITLLLHDFVVPAMYLRDVDVMSAWTMVHTEVLAGRMSTIVMYCFMKFVLALGIGGLAIALTCATCCITAVPYIGTVILLPLLVFGRCYSLYFLEQYGPAWRCFADDGWPPRCRRCGYDLRGNVSGACPECGAPIHGLDPPPPDA